MHCNHPPPGAQHWCIWCPIGLWPHGDGFLATVARSRHPRIGEAAGESAGKEVLQRNKARRVVDRQVVLACGATIVETCWNYVFTLKLTRGFWKCFHHTCLRKEQHGTASLRTVRCHSFVCDSWDNLGVRTRSMVVSKVCTAVGSYLILK